MKNIVLLFSFWNILSLMSCGRQSIVDTQDVRAVVPNKVLSLQADSTFMGEFPEILNPFNIQVVSDSILVIQDQVSENEPYHFKAYSIVTFKYLGSCVPNGRGPGEMIAPHIAASSASENCLYVNLNSVGKAFGIDINESIRSGETNYLCEYDLPSDIVDWVPLDDSKQLCLEFENNGFVFHTIDEKGETVATFDLFEGIDANRNATYLTQFIAHVPDSEKVVFAMAFFPQLCFLNAETGECFSVTVDKDYRQWEQILSSMLNMNTVQYYHSICVSPDHVFAVYDKLPLSEINENRDGCSVHVFDRDGDFGYDIRLKENISKITYDNKAKCLYCIEKTQGKIIRYDMAQLI